MTNTALKRACLGDAALAAKIGDMDRAALEQLTGSIVALGRKVAHRAQLGPYARKICERTQSSLIATLAPLDEAALELIEENVELEDEQGGESGDSV